MKIVTKDQKTVAEAATFLVGFHFAIDTEMGEAYRMPHASIVKLVEVSRAVMSYETAQVAYKIYVGTLTGVPHPSELVLLSPREWSGVLSGDVKLPEGWLVEELVRVL